jgi:pimeloyl-ACP methyl ester carboxylesterase
MLQRSLWIGLGLWTILCLAPPCLAPQCLVTVCLGQEEYIIELRNGMRLGPGIPSETDSLTTNSFQLGGSGQSQGGSIGILEDGLRRTYYNQSSRNVLQIQRSTATRLEQIELPSAAAVERSGAPPTIQGVVKLDRFNKYGRRTLSFMASRGQVDVLQGITLLTPTFAKVEVLRTKDGNKYSWDQRIAISSIPPDDLNNILHQALDMTKSSEWLRLVSFYLQAERYSQARATMAEALRRFPTELADRAGILGQTEQMLANQYFEEIKLRRNAGQPALAAQLLSSFPAQSLPVETQIQLGEEVEQLKQQLTMIREVILALQNTAAQLPDAEQPLLAPVIQEIADEVTLDTAVRLADFQRLRGGAADAEENLVALAVGGWLLGPGSGLQNLAVAKSLLRVRDTVREYLLESAAPRRQQLLEQLKGEEGAQPQLLAKLLANMKPIKPLPPHGEGDANGLYRLEAKMRNGDVIPYAVQLPPEYDPNRKYPCVLALPGSGEPPDVEIEWWCGVQLPDEVGGHRMGHATRHGYIVISPFWLPAGRGYQYSEVEHDRILTCYRDALRHVSVDTDRVFIAGHFDGATAAWDIAQAHPDLWAGAVIISPSPDKYIVHYQDNVRASNATPDEIPLGTYIVFGGADGTRFESKLGTVATRYLTSPAYDTLVVEYLGRGRERFLAELPRIMQWMEMSSRRRIRFPLNIETVTMRPGDRFFYWLEIPQVLDSVSSNPYQFTPGASGKFQATILDPTQNTIRVASAPSQNRTVTVWLAPDMIDFSRPISIRVRGQNTRHQLQPDIGIMLEDARSRADLMHVFWQSVTVP